MRNGFDWTWYRTFEHDVNFMRENEVYILLIFTLFSFFSQVLFASSFSHHSFHLKISAFYLFWMDWSCFLSLQHKTHGQHDKLSRINGKSAMLQSSSMCMLFNNRNKRIFLRKSNCFDRMFEQTTCNCLDKLTI